MRVSAPSASSGHGPIRLAVSPHGARAPGRSSRLSHTNQDQDRWLRQGGCARSTGVGQDANATRWPEEGAYRQPSGFLVGVGVCGSVGAGVSEDCVSIVTPGPNSMGEKRYSLAVFEDGKRWAGIEARGVRRDVPNCHKSFSAAIRESVVRPMRWLMRRVLSLGVSGHSGDSARRRSVVARAEMASASASPRKRKPCTAPGSPWIGLNSSANNGLPSVSGIRRRPFSIALHH